MDDSGTAASPDASAIAEEKPLEDQVPELEYTGERFLPGTRSTAEVAYDHIARYRLAERYVQGKEAIDLGCGAGYGTYSLARFATQILGVDISEEAVAYAAWRYKAPGLRYEVGDVTDVSAPDGSFEAAVAFEVIEHLAHPEALIKDVKRLLTEDGVFVVSTPDKHSYSNARNSVNRHHLSEMYPLEFRELLEHHFRHVEIYRQGALAGSIIAPDQAELPQDGGVVLESTRFSLPDPEFDREVPLTLYMIAVCTNGPAPEPLRKPYLVLDCDRQIYDQHADWRAALRALGWYQALEQQQRARTERLVRQLDSIHSARSWKVARRLARAKAGLDRVLRRG